MPTVPDIHRRGTRDEQATVASPPLTVGTLYFVTDEGVTERWDGTAWEVYSGAGTGDAAADAARRDARRRCSSRAGRSSGSRPTPSA